jgi:hypothetical protein
MSTVPSRIALIGVLVAVFAFATAAILFVTGTDSLQRLALLFGLFGVSMPAILALLKADQSAQATSSTSAIANSLNGAFDQRVRNAIRDVNAEAPGQPTEAVDIPGDPVATQAARFPGIPLPPSPPAPPAP